MFVIFSNRSFFDTFGAEVPEAQLWFVDKLVVALFFLRLMLDETGTSSGGDVVSPLFQCVGNTIPWQPRSTLSRRYTSFVTCVLRCPNAIEICLALLPWRARLCAKLCLIACGCTRGSPPKPAALHISVKILPSVDGDICPLSVCADGNKKGLGPRGRPPSFSSVFSQASAWVRRDEWMRKGCVCSPFVRVFPVDSATHRRTFLSTNIVERYVSVTRPRCTPQSDTGGYSGHPSAANQWSPARI